MNRLYRKIGGLGLAAVVAALIPVTMAGAQESVVPLDTVKVEVLSGALDGLGTGGRAILALDAVEIGRTPATTVTEALQWAFGIDLMSRSPALADVAIRGSSFEQVLVLVDGARMNDSQTGHFNLDLAIPLEQVERIEVLRGPAASLHGADAMAGVINIVTRREGSGSSVHLSAGSFGSASLALAHADYVGGVRADLAIEAHRSEGHREGTDYEMGSARLALGAPLAGQTLLADLAIAGRDFGADGFYAAAPSFERTRTATGSVRWRADGARPFSVEPLLSVRRHTDDFILRRHDPAFYRNEHTSTQLSGELIARARLSERVRSAAGVFVDRDRIESLALGDHSEDRLGAMFELATGSAGALLLSGGARADWHELHGHVFSPSASLAWPVTEAIRLRSSAGSAFRTPSWTERFYRDPEHEGDPELAPERAWSAELGLDLVPHIGTRLGLTASVRQARDLIDWARPLEGEGVVWRTRNVDRARFTNLEGELEIDSLLGLQWTARGAWLALESSAAQGFHSKYALRPLTRAVSLSVRRSFANGVELTVHGQNAKRVDESAYLRIDSRMAFSRNRSRLFLDLRNALDTQYFDIEGMPASGRSLAVGMAWGR